MSHGHTCWTTSLRAQPARTCRRINIGAIRPLAAFPVGYAAGGGISPFLTTGKPDASPAQTPTAPSLRTKALEAGP